MSIFQFHGFKAPPCHSSDAHFQIAYIPYSLNTTTAFYFATECSDVTVFVWGHVHVTILSYSTRLDQDWIQCPTL